MPCHFECESRTIWYNRKWLEKRWSANWMEFEKNWFFFFGTPADLHIGKITKHWARHWWPTYTINKSHLLNACRNLLNMRSYFQICSFANGDQRPSVAVIRKSFVLNVDSKLLIVFRIYCFYRWICIRPTSVVSSFILVHIHKHTCTIQIYMHISIYMRDVDFLNIGGITSINVCRFNSFALFSSRNYLLTIHSNGMNW